MLKHLLAMAIVAKKHRIFFILAAVCRASTGRTTRPESPSGQSSCQNVTVMPIAAAGDYCPGKRRALIEKKPYYSAKNRP